jgi:hypothetical protein
MWVWMIGLLLLGHGFIHAVWRTYGPKVSWLLPNASAPMLAALSPATGRGPERSDRGLAGDGDAD